MELIIESIASSVASKLAQYLVEPTINGARYWFCVNKIIKDLETQRKELLETQERVKDTKWQDKAKDLITDVDKLQQELMGIKSCFGRSCPTPKRYHLCKQLAEKTRTMIELNKNTPISDIEYFSSGDFMSFKSTTLAFDQILKALQDEGCYMIGLYGMGGSGKTTLVKELGKKAKESKLFDHVAFTTVSQTPNVRNIQGEIADLLHVKLEEETAAGRARRIALKLRSKEPTLVILDDVWKRLNLDDIGIPFDGHGNSCKILLTTRREQICTLMKCQTKILLDLLTEDEAWTLFQHQANVDDATRVVAQEISKECKGLPLAIATVGSSLRGKGIDEMQVALDKLRHSKPVDVDEGEKEAFSCLRLSYDYLRSEQAKSLFLMCAMFPKDHDISREDLFRYGKGLGLCGEVDSFEIARCQVNALINNLIDSCLLTNSEGKNDHFKMHDMVRDVAMWISRQNHTILVNPIKELNALPNDEKKDLQVVWYGKMSHFPYQPSISKLKTLVPNLEDDQGLSFTLFEDIQGLKLMALNSTLWHKLSMTESTQWLANIQTLRLVGLKLGNISFVASLRRLEILDLHQSTFNELPDRIEELSKLKLLDLSYCHIQEPCRVIKRCLELQELYVFPHKNTHVEVPFESPNSATFPKLKNYQVKVGQFPRVHYKFKALSSRGLSLGGYITSTSGAFVKDLLQRAKQVCLYDLQGGYKNIFPEMDQVVGGMNQCNNLTLYECDEIECFISTDSGHTSSSGGHHMLIAVCPNLHNLKHLKIDNCSKLTAVFPMSVAQTLVQLQELMISACNELRQMMTNEGEIDFQPDNSCFMFPQLKKLTVWRCEKLESIFPISCSQGFSQLQQIGIRDASKLKYVFGMSNYAFSRGCNLSSLKNLVIAKCPLLTSLFPASVAQTLPLLERLEIENCSELKHIVVNERGYSLEFPQLERLYLYHCPKLQYIFPISCIESLVNLKEMAIKMVSGLEYIFGSSDWENRSTNENEIQTVFPLLEEFELNDALHFLQILPENFRSRFPERKLILGHCPKLTTVGFNTTTGSEQRQRHSITPRLASQVHIFNCGVENIFHVQRIGLDEDQPQVIGMKFSKLKFQNLPKLRFLWTAPKQVFSLQFLVALGVHGCGKLKCIFNSVVLTSMQPLAYLFISDCEELEEIFEGNKNFHNPPLGLPKLKILDVRRCSRLRTIFSASVAMTLSQLEILRIFEAAQLEEVVSYEGQDIMDDQRVMLPQLKKIKLKNLPSLVKVWHGLNVHEIKLDKKIIEECPKLVPI